MGVKVKALEWREELGYVARAECPVGTYAVTEYAGMKIPFKLEGIEFGRPSLYLSSLEDAKSAAQEDFNRRILSSIEQD